MRKQANVVILLLMLLPIYCVFQESIPTYSEDKGAPRAELFPACFPTQMGTYPMPLSFVLNGTFPILKTVRFE